MMSTPRFRGMVVSYELARVSEYLANLYRILLDYLPDELSMFRGRKNRTATANGYGHILNHNSSTLSVEVETDIRGRGLDFMHCSEKAFFKDGAKFLNAVAPTLPDKHGTFAILESTPQGYDDHFHRMYERCVTGDSLYTALFFAWQEFHENVASCSPEEKDEIMNDLHVKHIKFGNEIELVNKYNLQPEQIKWRRNVLKDRTLDWFKKEYPASIEDAFAAADSRNVFDMSVLRKQLDRSTEPILQGEFNTRAPFHWQKPPQLQLQSEGLVRIWKEREIGEEYTAGSDHSLGKHDWNSCTILKRSDLTVVATLHGGPVNRNIIPAEFTEQMYHLLRYYNSAYCAIEINDIGASVADKLQFWQYENLLSHKTLFPKSTITRIGGWLSNASTRAHVIDRLTAFIQNELISIPDKETIKELMHFVFVTSKNDLSKARPQAAKKGQPVVEYDNTGIFDDRVFSLMSALLAHEALPAPLTARERAIENQQTDHDILYDEQINLEDNPYDIEVPFQHYDLGY